MMTRATDAVPVAATGLLLLASGWAVLALATDLALLDLAEMDMVFKSRVPGLPRGVMNAAAVCARRRRGWR